MNLHIRLPLPPINVIFKQETHGLCFILSDSGDAFMHHSGREAPQTWQHIESSSAHMGPLKSASPSRGENEVEEEGRVLAVPWFSGVVRDQQTEGVGCEM